MDFETINSKNYQLISLISTAIVGLLIAIHHFIDIGLVPFVALTILLVLVPIILMVVYHMTGNKIAYYVYILIDVWILVGFGLLDGFLIHTMKILGYYVIEPFQQLHGGRVFSQTGSINALLDGTGFLDFIGSLIVIYFLNKFIQGVKPDE